MQDLVKLIQAQQGSTGIVYAHQRKTCDWLAAKLGNAGVDAAAYHAGRDASERSRAQAQWMDGAFDCIVATVAFGMVRIAPALEMWSLTRPVLSALCMVGPDACDAGPGRQALSAVSELSHWPPVI